MVPMPQCTCGNQWTMLVDSFCLLSSLRQDLTNFVVVCTLESSWPAYQCLGDSTVTTSHLLTGLVILQVLPAASVFLHGFQGLESSVMFAQQ